MLLLSPPVPAVARVFTFCAGVALSLRPGVQRPRFGGAPQSLPPSGPPASVPGVHAALREGPAGSHRFPRTQFIEVLEKAVAPVRVGPWALVLYSFPPSSTAPVAAVRRSHSPSWALNGAHRPGSDASGPCFRRLSGWRPCLRRLSVEHFPVGRPLRRPVLRPSACRPRLAPSAVSAPRRVLAPSWALSGAYRPGSDASRGPVSGGSPAGGPVSGGSRHQWAVRASAVVFGRRPVGLVWRRPLCRRRVAFQTCVCIVAPPWQGRASQLHRSASYLKMRPPSAVSVSFLNSA